MSGNSGKHFDIRGMNLDQVMAVSERALDEIFEDVIDSAGDLCRDHGGTEDEIKATREQQRQWLEDDRAGHLAKLRAWFARGYEPLN